MNENERISILIDAISENFMNAFPGRPWEPQFNADGSLKKSFCNWFVNGVAQTLGYNGFWLADLKEPKMANDIIEFLRNSSDFMLEASGQMAAYHSNLGALVIAGQEEDPHGHVCVLRPGIPIFSNHWQKQAPRVANVGKEVFVDRSASFAFRTEPSYWALKSQI